MVWLKNETELLKYFHIWRCPSESRPYRPNEKKLDSKTVNSYFIGYSERSRGYKFYDPTIKSIFEMENAIFFEGAEFGGEIRLEILFLRRKRFRSLLLLLTVYRLLYLLLFKKRIWNLNKTILNNSPLKLRQLLPKNKLNNLKNRCH